MLTNQQHFQTVPIKHSGPSPAPTTLPSVNAVCVLLCPAYITEQKVLKVHPSLAICLLSATFSPHCHSLTTGHKALWGRAKR